MIHELIEKIQASATGDPNRDAIISYRTLRRTVGVLGILIPVILITFGYLFGNCCEVQPSISHYYFTNARELFVGTLISVSMFLFCYKGCSRLDSRASNLAGFFGLVTALFPTDIVQLSAHPHKASPVPPYFDCQQNLVSLTDIPCHGTIHLIAAACFFLIQAFMSIVLFTISGKPPALRRPEKKNRNRIYRTCGVIMIVCCLSIVTRFIIIHNETDTSPFTLIMESISLLAFGFSWLTKGKAIFPDKDDNNYATQAAH